ncbi:MAG: hypothetical protein A2284_07045 [Deltaproteobacteria bacterium RIFOXYA12_FULL_61_11]|nr:MAG: hypothetical protein A2284_07045 [Deltaproteobacteria bacterium RIFOXYA12_FULL_61_11]
MNSRYALLLVQLPLLGLLAAGAGPSCLGAGTDLGEVAIVSLPYALGEPFDQRLQNYYVEGMGAKPTWFHEHVQPLYDDPLLYLLDDFPNTATRTIANGCAELSDDPFEQVACASGSVHRWLMDHHEYRSGGHSAEGNLRSFCRDHARALDEVVKHIPGLGRGAIGNLFLTTHVLNTLTVRDADGLAYRYAFDAGHDKTTLRYYPLNEAAIQAGKTIFTVLGID